MEKLILTIQSNYDDNGNLTGESFETVIEPIKIMGRKTILGYRLCCHKILERNGALFDYGYVGTAKEVYLPKKSFKIDWELAKSLLVNPELLSKEA